MASAPAASMVHAFQAARSAPADSWCCSAADAPVRGKHGIIARFADGLHQLFGTGARLGRTQRWRDAPSGPPAPTPRLPSSAALPPHGAGRPRRSCPAPARSPILFARFGQMRSPRLRLARRGIGVEMGADSQLSGSRRERDRRAADPGPTRSAPLPAELLSRPVLRCQRLAHPAHAGPAMHSINMQCEFGHRSTPVSLMIAAGEGCRRCLSWRNGWVEMQDGRTLRMGANATI